MKKLISTLEDAVSRLQSAGVDTPLLNAQVMMARVIHRPRIYIIAHPEYELKDSESAAFASMLERRIAREPLAYITGVREFYGLELDIAPGVLVPRQETEVLVEECIQRIGSRQAVIADIGAGSGAIAVALGANLPNATIYSTEISPIALQVARKNVEKHHLGNKVYIIQGDLMEPLREMGLEFDAIVSNPPYIPSGEIELLQPEVRLYEPREALDGGPDGLDVYRRLFPEARGILSDGGFTAVEFGAGQDEAIADLARGAGFEKIDIIPDLAGIGRVGVAYI